MRIGVVPYINALPLCRYLPLPVTFANPRELDSAMKKGELDIALLPIASYLTSDYHALFHAGVIQSQGAVQSVCLFLQKGKSIRDIIRIKFSKESVTSILLFKVLYHYKWGLDLEDLKAVESGEDACLEIGDRALFFDAFQYDMLDLGAEWQEWTNLPFVYASWVARNAVDEEIIQTLIRARKEGIKNITTIASQIHDLPEKKLIDYLTHSIGYTATPKSLEGIRKFQDYCVELGLINKKREIENA